MPTYLEYLEKLKKRKVRRRRKKSESGVPFEQWTAAFATFQKATAYSVDKTVTKLAEEGYPEPPMFGALFRIAMAKYGLPILHMMLSEKPGVEPPRVTARAVAATILAILHDKDMLMKLIEKVYGIKPGTPEAEKYYERIRQYLEKALPYLVKYTVEFFEKVLGVKLPAKPEELAKQVIEELKGGK